MREPDLSPSWVAAALHVSVRHLHATFSRHGVSVASYIRNERLDRAARELVDAAHLKDEIGEIARQRRFTSPAHFSRVFIERFGQPPAAAPVRLRRLAARIPADEERG